VKNRFLAVSMLALALGLSHVNSARADSPCGCVKNWFTKIFGCHKSQKKECNYNRSEKPIDEMAFFISGPTYHAFNSKTQDIDAEIKYIKTNRSTLTSYDLSGLKKGWFKNNSHFGRLLEAIKTIENLKSLTIDVQGYAFDQSAVKAILEMGNLKTLNISNGYFPKPALLEKIVDMAVDGQITGSKGWRRKQINIQLTSKKGEVPAFSVEDEV